MQENDFMDKAVILSISAFSLFLSVYVSWFYFSGVHGIGFFTKLFSNILGLPCGVLLGFVGYQIKSFVGGFLGASFGAVLPAVIIIQMFS